MSTWASGLQEEEEERNCNYFEPKFHYLKEAA